MNKTTPDWKNTLLGPDGTIEDVIQVLESAKLGIALVVDSEGCLVGSVTDGDVRRGLLKHLSLSSPVLAIANTSPRCCSDTDSDDTVLAMMETNELLQIPILDSGRRVINLKTRDLLSDGAKRANWVFIMAGGQGTRLKPLTDSLPKPLVSIGNKPILEIILHNLIAQGFYRFCISVHHFSDQLEEYFGDGSKWGAEIQYIRESKPLGTAGSLGHFNGLVDRPFLVMNADLLTKVNFSKLLEFHSSQNVEATSCIRDYHIKVPFGLVKIAQHHLVEIDEKPTQKYFVNAGIYVMNPSVLEIIEKDIYLDMPTLLRKLISSSRKAVAVFPIHEYWLDIGRRDDLEKAQLEYESEFGDW